MALSGWHLPAIFGAVMSIAASGCLALPQGSAQAMSERRAGLVTENLVPRPYGYQYMIDEANTKASFQKSESRVRQKHGCQNFLL